MQHGDILKIEEIHQQGIMERRGKSSATQPEVLYAVMEDRVIPTATGMLEYPRITVIGTTTDEGMLPDAFINRFPLRPRLVPTPRAAPQDRRCRTRAALGVRVRTRRLRRTFANASRGVPREINNLVKNAVIWTRPGEVCTSPVARKCCR
jgi:Holliday junction resolvasome RuvABC ATP-dependent DNA helicase subunit